jgi:hypothetical protein
MLTRRLAAALTAALALTFAFASAAQADHDGVATPPPNDAGNTAQEVAFNRPLEGQSVLGASTQAGERLNCAGHVYGHTVWYAFTVTARGSVAVTTRGTSAWDYPHPLDTVLSVQRTGLISDAALGCQDDGAGQDYGGSLVQLTLNPGDYIIQVGTYDYDPLHTVDPTIRPGVFGPDTGTFSLDVRYSQDLDLDRDGYPRNRDCNDNNGAIHPNAPDVNNGIDDDCNGVVDPDKDSDGYPRPQDCNDGNRDIHPTAPEVRGNRVDEDCNGVKAGFRRIQVSPRLGGGAGASFAFEEITVPNVPKGALVTVKCTRSCGSARKVRRKRAGKVVVRGLHKTIYPRSRITVLVTKARWIGSYTQWIIRSNKAPRRIDRCVNAGQRKPARKCKATR